MDHKTLEWGFRGDIRVDIVGNVNDPHHVGESLEEDVNVRVEGLGVAEDGVSDVDASHVAQEVGELDAVLGHVHLLEALVALEQVGAQELEGRDLEEVGKHRVKVLVGLVDELGHAVEQRVALGLVVDQATLEEHGILHHVVVLADNVIVLHNQPRKQADKALDLERVTRVAELGSVSSWTQQEAHRTEGE